MNKKGIYNKWNSETNCTDIYLSHLKEYNTNTIQSLVLINPLQEILSNTINMHMDKLNI
jgi:hypothetical protein